MKRQISFAEAESAGKTRVTKRQRFLAEMEKAVPWPRLLAAIEPYYPKGERGRPPIGLERMLRIYFLQQWYGLSDEALEDALYDSLAMRAFAGIDLAVENAPDATTLLKFRRLLLKHDLTRKLFDEIGISLCGRGLMMKEGNAWHFGMKAHVRPESRLNFCLTQRVVRCEVNHHVRRTWFRLKAMLIKSTVHDCQAL